jgi:ATP-binding protein involved in chromosome partitioning
VSIDPRPAVFRRRFEPIRQIVAITGGKGGVGKSLCAATGALLAAADGKRTGLLDLDLHGASAHIFLGIDPVFPEEKGGILPLPGPCGLHFMSVAPFSGEIGLALRGAEISDAIRELLAVTIWPDLDLLVIDMPPGMGDEYLDVLRFIPRCSLVSVTTESAPAIDVTERLLRSVPRDRVSAGLIANMIAPGSPDTGSPASSNLDTGKDGAAAALARRHGIPLLARVPYFPELEQSIGDAGKLIKTPVAVALAPAVRSLLDL